MREKLWNLRNERLAHRQAKITEATGADATDEEIETFYQDMSELIRLLLHLVEAHAYDPKNPPRSTGVTRCSFGRQRVGRRQKAIQTIERPLASHRQRE